MKRAIFILVLLISVFLISCSQEQVIEPVELSDLQIQACNTADEAGTCNSRLPEVGIVLSEECCEALGKCC